VEHSKIAIIGCGNLGTSIANGLLSNNNIPANHLQVTRRNPTSLHFLKEKGVLVHSDNFKATHESEIIVIGLKPYNILPLLKEIKPHIQPHRQIIISLATGITLDEMYQILDPETVVYRAMPNIAADVMESITCICGRNFDAKIETKVKNLFDTVGATITIDEQLMEAATVLGACGIAYVLRFMRAMIQGGIQIGFDAATASQIVNQTVKGAAALMIEKKIHPEEAIDKVTTPKGCTIVGLNEMEHHGFSSAMVKGVLSSFQKIEKI
jgi:pyrroline-5-carboxylate reductase